MVFKGCMRKMIMIKNPGGEYFDEAYFVVKEEFESKRGISQNDMVKEANRIVAQNLLYAEGVKRKKCRGLNRISYILGLISGSALAFLCSIIIR